MTRATAIMPAIGALAAIAGLFVLARPGALRARLGFDDSEASTYALRIIGAMLFALGLFLGGFALALSWGGAA